MRALGDYLDVKVHACAGGTSVREDKKILSDGVHVVVGTPGRVFDMLRRQSLRSEHIKIFVLDEAVEMLPRGFKDQPSICPSSAPQFSLRHVIEDYTRSAKIQTHPPFPHRNGGRSRKKSKAEGPSHNPSIRMTFPKISRPVCSSNHNATLAPVTSPMPTSTSSETLASAPDLRRRVTSGAAAAAAATFPSSEISTTTDSGDDSSAETISDADMRIGGEINGQEAEVEKKKPAGGAEMNGGDGAPANFVYYRASSPAHRRVKESPLSSDAIFKQSHAGLFNLCIVVLIAVNSRLIIENLMKYGLLIRAGFWFSSRSLRDWPLFMCCLTLPVFYLCAFVVEKLAWHKIIAEPLVVSLHIILSTTAILCPVFVILSCDSAVLSGIALMLFASITWLKLVSYAHANYDMRALSHSADKGDLPFDSLITDYSQGANFKSLGYFMVAPTLCYQPTYPRTTCIREGWVIRQVVKLVIFTGLMSFIIEQYINPIVQNSQHPLKGNLLYALERVLKLSVPNLYVWLCMFYCFFHLWLNILAELLCFGDREFYKDWWNAQTIDEYWRMWNMPVHKWMVRHIYFPCIRNGLPKVVAILISFLVSAIFHELCIAVPCHIFKFWAFIGIMFQIPLGILTRYLQHKFRNSMVGNMIFWFFFSILGQPMCVLLYYHDVMNRKSENRVS